MEYRDKFLLDPVGHSSGCGRCRSSRLIEAEAIALSCAHGEDGVGHRGLIPVGRWRWNIDMSLICSAFTGSPISAVKVSAT